MVGKATGMMPPKKKGGKKVTHFRGTRAGNGWTIHHEMEPDQVRKPGGTMMDTGPQHSEPMVFSGPKANKMAAAHVAGLMNQGEDPEETAEPQPA